MTYDLHISTATSRLNRLNSLPHFRDYVLSPKVQGARLDGGDLLLGPRVVKHDKQSLLRHLLLSLDPSLYTGVFIVSDTL